MPRIPVSFLIPLALVTAAAQGLAANPVVTDRKQADDDFAVQGEYAGSVPYEGQDLTVGVQAIARGAGLFDVVAYPDGLPGAGWDGGERFEGTGRRVGPGVVAIEVVDSSGVARKGEIRGGGLAVLGPDGKEVARFPRVERESPTLGKKPPEGAVVIFDGPGPADESATLKNARVTPDGLLMEGVVSAADFGDAEWHVEFLLPYQPLDLGQARANSGAYVAGCYEVQILDSFGLEGMSNECGGIYGAAAPLINMCLPPLQWQTYDIQFTAPQFEGGKKVADARMTVRHNGTVIHENVALPSMTPGGPRKDEGPAGPLFLQDHGNPVRFRNVWVLPKR